MKTGYLCSVGRIFMLLLILAAGMANNAYGQQRQVTGMITDENDDPIPGVNVVIKGTLTGVVSDLDGKYTISVPGNQTVLIFSFMGYASQEIVVGNQTVVDILMNEDTRQIEEVVVVGYGTQRKVTLTGSVASVKGSEMVKSPSSNVANSLAGRLPGMIVNSRSGEPGNDDPKIYIRGRSTTGNDGILVIIDGIERDGLGQLNPNDIESINVLKDASAAIYGARAANGVILVTTKRGSVSKPVINLSFNQAFTQPTRKAKVAGSPEYAQMYNEEEIGKGNPARYTEAEIQKFRDGSDPYYPNTDWYDFIIRKLTPQHRTNLSVSGGADRAQYYLSFGEMYQSGHFKDGTTEVRQYNLRSNVDVKITDWLKVGMNLAGRYNKNHYPSFSNWDLYSHIFLDQPDWMPYWPGTDLLYPCRGSESLMNRVNDNGGYKEQEMRIFQGSLFFKLDIPYLTGLSIEGTGSYDNYNTLENKFNKPTYVYYKNATTGELEKGRTAYGSDLADLENKSTNKTLAYMTFKVNYERKFNQHNLAVMAGYEQQKMRNPYFWASRGGFLSTSLPELFAGGTDRNLWDANGSTNQNARQNYYGRATYDYAGKYIAQATFRYDGSPNFPEGKRFGFFPSFSAGWRISEESFMDNFTFLNNLKIRGSYGQMGNDQVPAFQYLSTYSYNNPYVIGNKDVNGLIAGSKDDNGNIINAVPNPDITWETAVTWNIGLDAQLWNGLLGVEFDYFTTRRSDILTKRNAIVPTYTGLKLPDENIGIVDNQGFELMLTHDNQVSDDFRYRLSGNVSFARNKVVFSDEQPAAEPYQMATGRPIGSDLYYVSLGIFRDENEVNSNPHLAGTKPGDIKYLDKNDDGEINDKDRERINQTQTPEIMFGLSAFFQYKAFDFSLLLQGQENAKVQFGGYFAYMSHSLGNFSMYRYEDRWTPDHTDATMPRAGDIANNRIQSTHWLFDAGFLRLKNVELGYNLPSSVCEKLRIQALRISLSGNNLFLIYDHMKDMGYDPEAPEYWYYPQQRTYNIGVSLTF